MHAFYGSVLKGWADGHRDTGPDIIHPSHLLMEERFVLILYCLASSNKISVYSCESVISEPQ